MANVWDCSAKFGPDHTDFLRLVGVGEKGGGIGVGVWSPLKHPCSRPRAVGKAEFWQICSPSN